MSIASLIKSIQNLTEKLNESRSNLPIQSEISFKRKPISNTSSNFTTYNKNKLTKQKKINDSLESKASTFTSQKNKLSQPSLKQELSYSITPQSKSAKVHVIGIPITHSENLNYSQLSTKEKAEIVLKAVHNCISKIQTLFNLEKQDTVIIQLREYAFEGKQKRFFTIEERNEILKILSQVFPVDFNLILGTGGIAYTIPVSLDNHNKINQVTANYERIEEQYPRFTTNMHLQYEKTLMYEKLGQESVTMILHNKNYILTNQFHWNGIDNKKPLSFSKIAPYQEIERLSAKIVTYQEIEQHHRFINSIIYNPGRIKKSFTPLDLDPNISIHNRTCAEIKYTQLIEPNYHSTLPNLFLINSASYKILPTTINEIQKWYRYFFQVDLKNGCQYGIFNSNASDSFFHINFYNYNIANSTLTMAEQSPYCKDKKIPQNIRKYKK